MPSNGNDGEDGDGGEGEETPPQFGLVGGLAVPAEVMQALQAMHSPEARDRQTMAREADQLRMRHFVETLSGGQLETLLWLMEILSAEGQGNYTTFLFRGILLATAWNRFPVALEE